MKGFVQWNPVKVSNIAVFTLPPFQMGSTLEEKDLLQKEQILSLKSRSLFRKVYLIKKAYRKSQKLFYFINKQQKHGRPSSHLNIVFKLDHDIITDCALGSR